MNDDLISRRAAIDALEKEKPIPFVNEDGSIDPFGAGQQNQWYRDGIAIMNMPSAQPERKKGRWIRHSIGHENTPWGFDCSACGKWFVIGEDTAEQYNYCPNCGAEMKGEDDD